MVCPAKNLQTFKMSASFAALDVNGDEVISRPEFAGAMSGMTYGAPQAMAYAAAPQTMTYAASQPVS